MEDTVGPLELVRDVLETSRTFYQTIRYLDGHTRNQVVALHERNANLALTIINRWMNYKWASHSTLWSLLSFNVYSTMVYLEPSVSSVSIRYT